MKTQAAKKSKTTYLYGKHALAEALRKRPECIGKVFLSAQFDDTDILGLLKKHHIPYSALSKNTERSLGDDASHQGVIATFAPEKLMVSFSDFIESFPGTPDTALVLLDELEDPHNVGAVIRSAAAFGIAGVLIPEHRQVRAAVGQRPGRGRHAVGLGRCGPERQARRDGPRVHRPPERVRRPVRRG